MGAEDDDRVRTEQLAAAARRVNRAVRVTAVGAASGDAVARALALLDEAAALLEADEHDGPHCQVGFSIGGRPGFDGELAPREFFPYSPVIGPSNPLSPPVELRVEEDRSISGSVTLHEGYCGPPWNLAHGGVIALIFDELLGVAGIMAAGGGFTGRLTIHYRKPTPILQELQLRGWLDRIEGRKIICKGEIRAGDVVTAEAEGLFVSVGGPLKDHDDAPGPVLPAGGG